MAESKDNASDAWQAGSPLDAGAHLKAPPPYGISRPKSQRHARIEQALHNIQRNALQYRLQQLKHDAANPFHFERFVVTETPPQGCTAAYDSLYPQAADMPKVLHVTPDGGVFIPTEFQEAKDRLYKDATAIQYWLNYLAAQERELHRTTHPEAPQVLRYRTQLRQATQLQAPSLQGLNDSVGTDEVLQRQALPSHRAAYASYANETLFEDANTNQGHVTLTPEDQSIVLEQQHFHSDALKLAQDSKFLSPHALSWLPMTAPAKRLFPAFEPCESNQYRHASQENFPLLRFVQRSNVAALPTAQISSLEDFLGYKLPAQPQDNLSWDEPQAASMPQPPPWLLPDPSTVFRQEQFKDYLSPTVYEDIITGTVWKQYLRTYQKDLVTLAACPAPWSSIFLRPWLLQDLHHDHRFRATDKGDTPWTAAFFRDILMTDVLQPQTKETKAIHERLRREPQSIFRRLDNQQGSQADTTQRYFERLCVMLWLWALQLHPLSLGGTAMLPLPHSRVHLESLAAGAIEFLQFLQSPEHGPDQTDLKYLEIIMTVLVQCFSRGVQHHSHQDTVRAAEAIKNNAAFISVSEYLRVRICSHHVQDAYDVLQTTQEALLASPYASKSAQRLWGFFSKTFFPKACLSAYLPATNAWLDMATLSLDRRDPDLLFSQFFNSITHVIRYVLTGIFISLRTAPQFGVHSLFSLWLRQFSLLLSGLNMAKADLYPSMTALPSPYEEELTAYNGLRDGLYSGTNDKEATLEEYLTALQTLFQDIASALPRRLQVREILIDVLQIQSARRLRMRQQLTRDTTTNVELFRTILEDLQSYFQDILRITPDQDPESRFQVSNFAGTIMAEPNDHGFMQAVHDFARTQVSDSITIQTLRQSLLWHLITVRDMLRFYSRIRSTSRSVSPITAFLEDMKTYESRTQHRLRYDGEVAFMTEAFRRAFLVGFMNSAAHEDISKDAFALAILCQIGGRNLRFYTDLGILHFTSESLLRLQNRDPDVELLEGIFANARNFMQTSQTPCDFYERLMTSPNSPQDLLRKRFVEAIFYPQPSTPESLQDSKDGVFWPGELISQWRNALYLYGLGTFQCPRILEGPSVLSRLQNGDSPELQPPNLSTTTNTSLAKTIGSLCLSSPIAFDKAKPLFSQFFTRCFLRRALSQIIQQSPRVPQDEEGLWKALWKSMDTAAFQREVAQSDEENAYQQFQAAMKTTTSMEKLPPDGQTEVLTFHIKGTWRELGTKWTEFLSNSGLSRSDFLTFLQRRRQHHALRLLRFPMSWIKFPLIPIPRSRLDARDKDIIVVPKFNEYAASPGSGLLMPWRSTIKARAIATKDYRIIIPFFRALDECLAKETPKYFFAFNFLVWAAAEDAQNMGKLPQTQVWKDYQEEERNSIMATCALDESLRNSLELCLAIVSQASQLKDFNNTDLKNIIQRNTQDNWRSLFQHFTS